MGPLKNVEVRVKFSRVVLHLLIVRGGPVLSQKDKDVFRIEADRDGVVHDFKAREILSPSVDLVLTLHHQDAMRLEDPETLIHDVPVELPDVAWSFAPSNLAVLGGHDTIPAPACQEGRIDYNASDRSVLEGKVPGVGPPCAVRVSVPVKIQFWPVYLGIGFSREKGLSLAALIEMAETIGGIQVEAVPTIQLLDILQYLVL